MNANVDKYKIYINLNADVSIPERGIMCAHICLLD